jgi:hypothetical protein
VSGLVYPGREPVDEAENQIRLCISNQCLLARSFLGSGIVPVMDYVVVSPERLAEYHDLLRGVDIRLVTLEPGIAAALARDRDRPEKTVAHLWQHLHYEMRERLYPEGLWIDNHAITVGDVVEQILTYPWR